MSRASRSRSADAPCAALSARTVSCAATSSSTSAARSSPYSAIRLIHRPIAIANPSETSPEAEAATSEPVEISIPTHTARPMTTHPITASRTRTARVHSTG